MDRTLLLVLLCLQVFLLVTASTPLTSPPSAELAEDGKMSKQHDEKHGVKCILRRQCGSVRPKALHERNRKQDPRSGSVFGPNRLRSGRRGSRSNIMMH